MIKNTYRSSRNVQVILVRFLLNLNFLDRFSKGAPISNFKKTLPGGTELFHADEGTDRLANMTKLIVSFAILQTRLKTKNY